MSRYAKKPEKGVRSSTTVAKKQLKSKGYGKKSSAPKK